MEILAFFSGMILYRVIKDLRQKRIERKKEIESLSPRDRWRYENGSID